MNADATSSKGSLLLLALCVPLIGGVAALVWMFGPWEATAAANNTAAKDSKAAIPNLGGRGRNLPQPANTEETPQDDGAEPVGDDGTEETPEDVPEVLNTEREIDIWLNNLAIATKAGDRRGQQLNHDMLLKARPHELVDQRVENALLNEQNAHVRIQFFAAFHSDEAKHDWALSVYGTRTSKFLGTDTQYEDGEVEELKILTGMLFSQFVKNWREQGKAADERITSLLRNLLTTETPDWLLRTARNEVFLPAIQYEIATLVEAFKNELRALLLRATAEPWDRELFFTAFVLSFDPAEQIFVELEREEWWAYASALAAWFEPRYALSGRSAWPVDWLDELLANEELPKLFTRLLQGNMDNESKRLLIQRIAAYEVPDGHTMIESGLARKDANYSDYLTALGAMARNIQDLQRLTTAADDPDVLTAQSAIEGLRQSSLPNADTELRKVLEQGSNLGVKSQALGALLSRSDDKNELIEEYLNDNKEASLRAVAVAHVPIEDTDWLMRIVEEDASPRVRTSALNRLGAIVPATTRQRKELRGFFLRIQTRDNSPVIRSAARKYADALEE